MLSFSFTSKEPKANPMPSIHEKLECLDIKVLVEYIRGSTTHVVSRKRNTSNCLQALINGKYIVDYTFIDAITTATDSRNDEISPLESDFESNWPNELQYLPHRGTESIQRPSDAYAPDPNRQEIFEGYTFIFYDQSQFENLLAPITNGRGKALLRRVDPSTATVEDFVRYVKDVAGEKGLGGFEDRNDRKGVVIVRYQPTKEPISDWYSDFAIRVALSLDHRLVEQNEFLDAILNNDASVLRKPLEIEQSGIVAPPPTAGRFSLIILLAMILRLTVLATIAHLREPQSKAATSTNAGDAMNIDKAPASSVSAPVQPARRVGRSRKAITSRFKGFDNDFDIPALPASVPTGQAQAPALQTENLFISQSQNAEFGQQPSESVVSRTRSSRKRSEPPVDEENDEDVLDQLAPAAANLKRRRLADEIARKRRGEPSPPRPAVAELEPKVLVRKSKKVKAEIDVLEVARQRREEEEEIARAEREALQEAMDGMDIDQIRNLAIIEEMEVKRPAPPPGASAHGDEGDRWDERWNGRKNFKKFRKRGEGGPRVLHKVIVPLEEVKKKDFGIGDEYWLEGDKNTARKKKGKERVGEIQSMGLSQSQATPVRGQAHEINAADETGKVDPLTPSQKATRSQKSTDKTNISPNRPQQNKRAAEPMAKPAPAKKARQAARRQDSDDSEDGLGFRFRKKR